ncbi:MAG: DoxX family protein [Bacteroidetes bacterium]|nr:DoxX family protein [Bacteroidota bacterium]
MKQSTISILYWVFTILFSGLMIFTSIGGIGPTEETVKIFVKGLGYPVYFIQYISWAKIIGAIAILIPGLKKIKEWAYAGLFFDLSGAIYSGISVSGKFDPLMLTMLIWIVPGIISYILWSKKNPVQQPS